MSNRFFGDTSDDVYDGDRKRGLWGLTVLAMLAVIVITFVVLFTGSKEGGPDDLPVATDTASTEPITNLTPSTSKSPTPSSAPTSSSSPSSKPSPSKPPQTDEALALAERINALRAQSNLPAVPAAATRGARECAAANGSSPSCRPHFIYATVASTDALTTMDALQQVSATWFLEATTTRMEIGWAKLAGGNYNVAVLKNP